MDSLAASQDAYDWLLSDWERAALVWLTGAGVPETARCEGVAGGASAGAEEARVQGPQCPRPGLFDLIGRRASEWGREVLER